MCALLKELACAVSHPLKHCTFGDPSGSNESSGLLHQSYWGSESLIDSRDPRPLVETEQKGKETETYSNLKTDSQISQISSGRPF